MPNSIDACDACGVDADGNWIHDAARGLLCNVCEDRLLKVQMNLKYSFGWKQNAGLITVYGPHDDSSALHLFVQYKDWFWGRAEEAYDCCYTYYGLGPLFLFVRMN